MTSGIVFFVNARGDCDFRAPNNSPIRIGVTHAEIDGLPHFIAGWPLDHIKAMRHPFAYQQAQIEARPSA